MAHGQNDYASTESTLVERLNELVEVAEEERITLGRNWTCRSTLEETVWDVEFVQVRGRTDDASDDD
jgi:hypothetical protein